MGNNLTSPTALTTQVTLTKKTEKAARQQARLGSPRMARKLNRDIRMAWAELVGMEGGGKPERKMHDRYHQGQAL